MARPSRSAFDLLAHYAAYHRDRRNIVTHFFGVPMVVFAVGVLLARLGLMMGGFWVSAAWVAYALAAAWYLTRGEFMLGLAVSGAVGVLALLAHPVALGSAGAWLAWGVGFFVFGCLVQFIGHYYEGRAPAFADDPVGLLVGPMFVVMELLALAGFFKSLVARIERSVGPTVLRDLAHPAT